MLSDSSARSNHSGLRASFLNKANAPSRFPLPPILCLPPELLCAIFLDVADDAVSHCKLLTTHAPWHLGHVCRHWRAVASTYRALWTTVSINPASKLDEIEELLLRTGRTAPLRVHFNGASKKDGELATSPALKLTLTTSPRWIAATFRRIRDWNWTVGLDLSQLERVEIFLDRTTAPSPSNTFNPASCPRLRYAALTGPRLCGDLTDALPWPQLTHLRIAYLPEASLNVLRHATNLVECVVGTTANHIGLFRALQLSTFTLPHLRILRTESPVLLQLIDAPCLETLSLWSETGGLTTEDLAHILPFVARSKCTLRSLALFSCTTIPPVLDVLQGLPHLHSLLVASEFDSDMPTPSIDAILQQITLCKMLNLRTLYLGCRQPTPTNLTPELLTSLGTTSITTLRIFPENWRAPAQRQADGDVRANAAKLGVDVQWIPSDHESLLEQQLGRS